MENFNAFKTFCEDNGYELTDIEARKAYEAANSGKETKRKLERKHVTMLCMARGVEGSTGVTLFKQATMPNVRSVKDHNAWVLTSEALSAGAESAYCITIQETFEG